MNNPDAPADALRAALADLVDGLPPRQAARAVERLIANYRGATPTDAPILRDRADVVAYAAYRMPATFAAVRSALAAFADAVPGWAPGSHVDVGGGTGAAIWAVNDTWAGDATGAEGGVGAGGGTGAEGGVRVGGGALAVGDTRAGGGAGAGSGMGAEGDVRAEGGTGVDGGTGAGGGTGAEGGVRVGGGALAVGDTRAGGGAGAGSGMGAEGDVRAEGGTGAGGGTGAEGDVRVEGGTGADGDTRAGGGAQAGRGARGRSVTVLDWAEPALALGREIAAAHPALRDVRWQRSRIGAALTLESADLVTVSYVLNELTGPDRAALVDAAASAGQAVVIVEAGTPDGYARVIEARDRLIAAGFHVAAPCPHSAACPIVPGTDWCHFAARVSRSSLHRQVKGGSLAYEDEKFSYVAATRFPPAPAPSRVVRRPQLRKGQVLLDLCETSPSEPHEQLRRRTVTKRHGDLYKAARDAAWGDAWPPPEERARPDATANPPTQ